MEQEQPAKNQRQVNSGRRAKWWKRKGTSKRGFTYFTYDDRKIIDDASLEKIRSLVIPPAWRNVRISPSSGGKLQAVGIDTSARIQYIYHPKFAEAQQRKKFARIEKFGEFMPQLRRVTNEHISLDGFPLEKVLAIMIRLINSLYIRMGTDKSVKHFRTYGITTLTNRHVTINQKGKVVFEFVGKSRIKHKKVFVDPELALLLKELTGFGRGRKLFQYSNGENSIHPIRPHQINAYIKSVTAPEFSAKDFRTWGASLLAAVELAQIGVGKHEKETQKNIVNTIKKVATELGNTPSICRKSYIHPKVLKAYSLGLVLDSFTPRRLKRAKKIESELEPEEISLMKLFEHFH